MTCAMEGGVQGLVVVASTFFIQVFVFGVTESIGVYNIEFLDYFDNDTVGVSLIASINLLVFFCSGPLISLLMKKLSFRAVTMLGSCLVMLGVLLARFLLYLPALCVCLGLLTGLGSGMVFIPSSVLCGLYYERHRSLATGVATGGSGFGGAVMPIVVGYLIRQWYGWKGSLIVLAGINLNLFVCSALLKPPSTLVKDVTDSKITDTVATDDDNKDTLEHVTLRHIYLLTDVGFTVYFLSNLLWNINTGMFTAFIAEFATERGIDPLYAAWLVTICGFGCFLGGLIGALLGNVFELHRMHLYIVACVTFGAITAVVPLGSEFGHFAGSLFCAKTSFGVILGLQVVVLTDLIGSSALGDGLGYLMLSNGIGSFIGPYLAGYLRMLHGTYDGGFYAGAIVTAAAGVIMLLIPLLRSLCNRKTLSTKTDSLPDVVIVSVVKL